MFSLFSLCAVVSVVVVVSYFIWNHSRTFSMFSLCVAVVRPCVAAGRVCRLRRVSPPLPAFPFIKDSLWPADTRWGSQQLCQPPRSAWKHIWEVKNWTGAPEALNGEQPGARGELVPVVRQTLTLRAAAHLSVRPWWLPPCREAAVKLESVQVHIPAVMVRGRLRRGTRESCCYLHAVHTGPSSAHRLCGGSAGKEADTLPNWFFPLWINLRNISLHSSFNCLVWILKTVRNAFRWWTKITPSQWWFTSTLFQMIQRKNGKSSHLSCSKQQQQNNRVNSWFIDEGTNSLSCLI